MHPYTKYAFIHSYCNIVYTSIYYIYTYYNITFIFFICIDIKKLEDPHFSDPVVQRDEIRDYLNVCGFIDYKEYQ